MKTTTIFLIALLSFSTLQAQYNSENLKLDNISAQKTWQYGYLQLYPVRANKTFFDRLKGVGNYVALKEALEKKKVRITEHIGKENEGGGEVNTLFIENVSKDTIMVLAGEVVKGGKQDRVIAQDFILHPGSGKKDVSVFCVEAGRWEEKSTGNSFKSYFSISSNEIRKAAAVNKDQQEVWEKVAEMTSKNNATTSTGSLTALEKSDSLNINLENYRKHFQKTLMNEPDVIGVIAIAGNQILGCDLFASHALFEKHFPNLINSYATGAISAGKKAAVTPDKVQQYFKRLVEDESKQDKEIEKNGTMLRDGKRKIHISTF